LLSQTTTKFPLASEETERRLWTVIDPGGVWEGEP
jgi:hypothetical protein